MRRSARRQGSTHDGVARLAGDAATDPFGRGFDGRSVLEPPFFGAKVTGLIRPVMLRVLLGTVLVLVSILMFQQAYQEYSP